MLISCTLKNAQVYLPTVAKTEAGFYMNREPVAVVPASDADALRRELRKLLKHGNPAIPTPKRDALPRPVLLKYAGERSWSAFMRGASEWDIYEKDGKYQITPYRKDPEGSQNWVADSERRLTFPLGTSADEVIERMIVILQQAAQQ